MATTAKIFPSSDPKYTELATNNSLNEHTSEANTINQNITATQIEEDGIKPNEETTIPPQYQRVDSKSIIGLEMITNLEEALLEKKKNLVLVIVIFILNLITPGIGTIVLGCTIKDHEMSRWVLIGVFQLLSAPLIIGWLWALKTAIEFWNERRNE